MRVVRFSLSKVGGLRLLVLGVLLWLFFFQCEQYEKECEMYFHEISLAVVL